MKDSTGYLGRTPGLPLASCMTLGQSLGFSEPSFLTWRKEEGCWENSTFRVKHRVSA